MNIVNYQRNIKILEKWGKEGSLLKLKNINQILFHDGKSITKNVLENGDVWFLLEMTDGWCYAYIEIQVDKN